MEVQRRCIPFWAEDFLISEHTIYDLINKNCSNKIKTVPRTMMFVIVVLGTVFCKTNICKKDFYNSLVCLHKSLNNREFI